MLVIPQRVAVLGTQHQISRRLPAASRRAQCSFSPVKMASLFGSARFCSLLSCLLSGFVLF